jgi:hypothetical protein
MRRPDDPESAPEWRPQDAPDGAAGRRVPDRAPDVARDGVTGVVDDLLPPGGHLDEGAAHAFVDGALSEAEAARVIAHMAGCAACAGLVAEARGLAAAAARVLGALDDVPAGVVPPAAAPAPRAVRAAVTAAPAVPGAAGARRRAWSWPVRAAAGVVLAAGVGSAAWRATRGRVGEERALSEVSTAASAPAVEPVLSTQNGPQPLTATGAAPAPGAAADSAAGPAVPPALRTTRSGGRPGNTMPLAAEPPASPTRREASAQDALAVVRKNASSADPAPPAAGDPALPPPPPPPALPPAPSVAVESAPDTNRDRVRAAAPPTLEHALAARARSAEGRAAAGAATGVVSGVVLDDAGRPLAATQLLVGGAARGTTTDSAGRFVVAGVPAGPTTLRARRIGFEARQVEVAVDPRDTARAVVRLRREVTALSAVAVTGAGVATRADDAGVVGCYAVRGSERAGDAALPSILRLTTEPGAQRRAAARRAAGRAGGAPAADVAAAAAAAAPAPAAAASGAALDTLGAARGQWTLAGDTLVVRWPGAAPVSLARSGDGWAGRGVTLERTGAPGASCRPR